MSSNVNPSNINGNYPVAGQDNDSQGFRDNFTNIRTNFTFAKSEIEELQSKVVLKSALTSSTSTTVSNNMAGAVISGAKLSGTTFSAAVDATPQTEITLDYTNGLLQKFTAAGPITINFGAWPASGTYTVVRLWLTITDVAHTVTFPASVSAGLPKIGTMVGQVMTPVVGNYIIEFGTVDAGITVYASPVVKP